MQHAPMQEGSTLHVLIFFLLEAQNCVSLMSSCECRLALSMCAQNCVSKLICFTVFHLFSVCALNS